MYIVRMLLRFRSEYTQINTVIDLFTPKELFLVIRNSFITQSTPHNNHIVLS